MNELEVAAYRIERLKDAITRISNGNKADFGRKLGFQDGAFIRQMIIGIRPISEKTIWAIENLHGMRGWFNDSSARISEPEHQYGHSWPFPDIDEAKIRSLGDRQRAQLEVIILTAASQIGLDVNKKKNA